MKIDGKALGWAIINLNFFMYYFWVYSFTDGSLWSAFWNLVLLIFFGGFFLEKMEKAF